jgi:hypothetical protein
MFNISEFFKKIQNKQTQGLFVRQVVSDSIKKYAQFSASPEQIEYNSTTIILKNISSAQKSNIFIKKQQIISEINRQQSILFVTDIK